MTDAPARPQPRTSRSTSAARRSRARHAARRSSLELVSRSCSTSSRSWATSSGGIASAMSASFTRGRVGGDHPGRVIRTHPARQKAPKLLDQAGRSCMSNLIAIAYPDLTTARNVASELGQLTKEQSIVLDDIVVIERRPDGKVKLHQAVGTAGAGAAGGALWGGLIGLIFLAPLLGMAVGAAAGGVGGKPADVGINDDFLRVLGVRLQPGAAALIALGSTDARDKVIERVKPYGGEIIQTSLSDAEEEQLRSMLGAGATVA